MFYSTLFRDKRGRRFTTIFIGFMKMFGGWLTASNRLKSIRARMRESVMDKTDLTRVYKAIADEVIQDLRHRLKAPRYCNRKKLKVDHVDYCKKFRDALVGVVNVLDGRLMQVEGEWLER